MPDMKEAIEKSELVNELIKASKEYQRYIETKRKLCDNMGLYNQVKEMQAKNRDVQNRLGVNAYDEMIDLTKEYDELLHNSLVSDFLRAEQRICRLMQELYETVADGLELE